MKRKAKRKHISEFAINMAPSMTALVQQDSLEDPTYISMLSPYSFHIYMVVRRPRIAVIPETFRFEEKSVSGTFTVQKGPLVEEVHIVAPSTLGSNVKMTSSYPYTFLTISDKSDVELFRAKSANFLARLSHTYPAALDLEVLYIGQSYGDNGSRVAADRLKSHSTLQSIYAQAMVRAPDHDIWIVLWEFQDNFIMSFDGRDEDYPKKKTEDDAHTENVLRTGVTEQQKINFAEAALIRYFQPAYNKIFKKTFPSPAHSTYSECYDIDLSAVCVELQSEQLGTRLWSCSVQPNFNHFAKFDLHSRSKRRSMFDL